MQRRIAAAGTGLIVGLTALGPATADPLTIVTGNGYPPFADSSLPRGGLATALVRKAFAAVDQPVRFAYRPWKRGYAMTRAGTYAATFPYIKTPSRAAEMLYSAPIVRVASRAWTLADSPLAADSATDLRGEMGCLPNGYAPAKATKDLYANDIIERVSPRSITHCFRLLKRGRVDFVESNGIVGRWVAGKVFDDPDRVRMLSVTLDRNSLSLIVSKQYPNARELLARFNRGLRRIRKNGTHARVIERYLNATRTARSNTRLP